MTYIPPPVDPVQAPTKLIVNKVMSKKEGQPAYEVLVNPDVVMNDTP